MAALPMHDMYRQRRRLIILQQDFQATVGELGSYLVGQQTGDAQAADTYAKAYGKNKEFFAFYRSLDAYKTAFDNENVFVMEPKGEFFDYFNNIDGKPGAAN